MRAHCHIRRCQVDSVFRQMDELELLTDVFTVVDAYELVQTGPLFQRALKAFLHVGTPMGEWDRATLARHLARNIMPQHHP